MRPEGGGSIDPGGGLGLGPLELGTPLPLELLCVVLGGDEEAASTKFINEFCVPFIFSACFPIFENIC